MGFEFYKQKFRNNIVCSFNVFFSFINENRTCDNFCYKPFKRRRDLNAKHYLWCQRRKGKGNQQKKEDITTSEVFLFMQRCSSLYDAVFRQWWCINSCFIFMYSGEYHIWSSKTSFEEFFLPFSAGPISHVDTRSWSPEEWTCRRVSAWDLTSQAFHRVSLLKSINWLLRSSIFVLFLAI